MNKENRLVGFLWHQGEHDASERADYDVTEIETFYYEQFKALLTDFRARYTMLCGYWRSGGDSRGNDRRFFYIEYIGVAKKNKEQSNCSTFRRIKRLIYIEKALKK